MWLDIRYFPCRTPSTELKFSMRKSIYLTNDSMDFLMVDNYLEINKGKVRYKVLIAICGFLVQSYISKLARTRERMNVFWMEAASLDVMTKRHGYRILIFLDFYTLRCGLNRRLRQFGESRVILDSFPLFEGAGNPLIGFSQFSFSSLLKFRIISDGLLLFFILNDAIM